MLDKGKRKTLVSIFSELGKYTFTAIVIGYFITDKPISARTLCGAVIFSVSCFVTAVMIAKED